MIAGVILCVLVFCFSGTSIADTLKTEPELRPFGDKIMAALVKGGISAAFAGMKPYVLIPNSEFESLSLASKAQRDQFGARYGKTIGFEFIGQKKVGDSLVRLTYIEKTEKHVLPWIFFFYRTPTGWALNSFVWNDQMTQLFYQE
jgi:hypothetical protein